jgi:hypothetical protein
MRIRMQIRSVLVIASISAVLAVSLAACAPAPSAGSAAPGASAAIGPRPSSSATLTVVSPTDGQSVAGPTVHVVINLAGATIVSATTTDIRPDQGHIHLYVDNNLVSMNYGSTLDQAVPAGTHVLRAEFVAADHVPFNPRVVTPDVVFTVTP